MNRMCFPADASALQFSELIKVGLICLSARSFQPATTCQICCLEVPFPEGHPDADGGGEGGVVPGKMLR
jgi:hypothetical protein